MPISFNLFSSLIELLAVFNLSYLGSESVQKLVTLNLFGLATWEDKVWANAVSAANTLEVLNNSVRKQSTDLRNKSALKVATNYEEIVEFRDSIRDTIKNFNANAKIFYLLGAFCALFVLVQDGFYHLNYTPPISPSVIRTSRDELYLLILQRFILFNACVFVIHSFVQQIIKQDITKKFLGLYVLVYAIFFVPFVFLQPVNWIGMDIYDNNLMIILCLSLMVMPIFLQIIAILFFLVRLYYQNYKILKYSTRAEQEVSNGAASFTKAKIQPPGNSKTNIIKPKPGSTKKNGTKGNSTNSSVK